MQSLIRKKNIKMQQLAPSKPPLFIGRFQPFHRGHLDVIHQILRRNKKIIIGIGSAQYSGNAKNPYSAELRERMIRQALREAKIPARRFTLVQIPDIHNDKAWVKHVERLCPEFGEVWSGTKKVQKLFQKSDRHLILTPKFHLDISGTKIRIALKKGRKWQHMVSPSITKIMTKIS